MNKRHLKVVADERKVYYRPPVPPQVEGDYYQDEACQALDDLGPKWIKSSVEFWLNQEAELLTDQDQRWRAKQFDYDGWRIIPGDRLNRRAWGGEVRTTATMFVPTHYDSKKSQRSGQSDCTLSGLSLRVTEAGDLAWKPAEVPMPTWFHYHDRGARLLVTINQRSVRPLKRKFERARAEDFPSLILASIYLDRLI